MTPGGSGISTPITQEDSKKRCRTSEEEAESSKMRKQEQEMEELKVRQAFLEGRIVELERNQDKLERENHD